MLFYALFCNSTVALADLAVYEKNHVAEVKSYEIFWVVVVVLAIAVTAVMLLIAVNKKNKNK